MPLSVDVFLSLFISCFLLGAFAGFLAGLLGIGGGLVIVPTLVYLLPLTGISNELIMPMALATSLASIAFTSTSAAFSHHKNSNIPWPLARKVALYVAVGSVFGAFIAEKLSSEMLTHFFAGAVIVLASYMLMSIKFSATRTMPNTAFFSVVSALIGTFSSLLGIAGGTVLVPVLNYFGVNIRYAMGIATVSGLSIATFGSLGFIYTGLQQTQLPMFSVGYIYLPALFSIVLASLFFAKLGVSMASKLPIVVLKKAFSIFLIIVAIKMIVN